ncbi:OB-fold domain-containing protein [Frankia sp. AiPs1]|uniref:Zn-ribbon domain-containing OB-fold protein n=1 Tax=Frankia sp. AiPs1 TaxID=573493 RepID=UPI002044782D|nr:OB-fold domain-containing protein [Frankia sp. AiPs1]
MTAPAAAESTEGVQPAQAPTAVDLTAVAERGDAAGAEAAGAGAEAAAAEAAGEDAERGEAERGDSTSGGDSAGSPEPPPEDEAEDDDDGTGPLWAALREDRFVLSRCLDCRSWLPPRPERCRHCAGPTDFAPAAGAGVVESYLVIRHPSVPAFAGRPPYVLALVTLAEGVRLAGRLDGVTPGEARTGQPVRAAFHVRPGADTPSVIFRPRRPAGAGAR